MLWRRGREVTCCASHAVCFGGVRTVGSRVKRTPKGFHGSSRTTCVARVGVGGVEGNVWL